MPTKKAAKKSSPKSQAAKAKATPKAKKSASPKSRTATKSKAKSKAGEKEVTIDRRRKADRREEADASPAQPQLEKRAKVQRRRQIDPTTCERDYSEAEVEFMNAMDEYKRTSGRMFPTCSEVLEVIRELGYVQLTPAEKAIVRPEPVEQPEGGDAELDGVDEESLEVEEVSC